MKHRTRYSAEFKAKVALAALSNSKLQFFDTGAGKQQQQDRDKSKSCADNHGFVGVLRFVHRENNGFRQVLLVMSR